MKKNPYHEINLLREFYNKELRNRFGREFYKISDHLKKEIENTLAYKLFRLKKAWSNLLNFKSSK